MTLIEQVMQLYAVGLGCGIVLSLLPFVIGGLIDFSLNLMKGG